MNYLEIQSLCKWCSCLEIKTIKQLQYFKELAKITKNNELLNMLNILFCNIK